EARLSFPNHRLRRREARDDGTRNHGFFIKSPALAGSSSIEQTPDFDPTGIVGTIIILYADLSSGVFL
ncbi:MAG TPA: hypothetical protein PLY86_22110, partial [bacterium]|nr:hypothetical protein [bacterium]